MEFNKAPKRQASMRINNDLTEKTKNIFRRFGFVQLEGYAKPYYANGEYGKAYRVIGHNKLKELSDGATPTRYGRVKLKLAEGVFVNKYVHRLICGLKSNPENKAFVHHKDGNKAHNSLGNLDWATPKENAQARRKMTPNKHTGGDANAV